MQIYSPPAGIRRIFSIVDFSECELNERDYLFDGKDFIRNWIQKFKDGSGLKMFKQDCLQKTGLPVQCTGSSQNTRCILYTNSKICGFVGLTVILDNCADFTHQL